MKISLFSGALLSSMMTLSAWGGEFVGVSLKDFPQIQSPIEVQNLPRIRSQDSLGICYGMSSAVVAQHYYCSALNLDCKNLTPKEEISPLSAAVYTEATNPNDEEARGKGIAGYTSLRIENGGSSALSLFNMAMRFQLIPESCFQFDQVVQKYGNDEDAVNSMIQRVRKTYEKNKQMEAGTCVGCIQEEIKNSFGISLTPKEVQMAVKQNSFEEFLYFTTVGRHRCRDMISLPPDKLPYVQIYPLGKERPSYEQRINYLKNVLKGGRPADINGICLIPRGNVCEGSHSVAVTGYRKQCTPTGVCREMLRIQNSWGEEWQNKFNGGWVDAKSLIDSRFNQTFSHFVPRSEVVATK